VVPRREAELQKKPPPEFLKAGKEQSMERVVGVNVTIDCYVIVEWSSISLRSRTTIPIGIRGIGRYLQRDTPSSINDIQMLSCSCYWCSLSVPPSLLIFLIWRIAHWLPSVRGLDRW